MIKLIKERIKSLKDILVKTLASEINTHIIAKSSSLGVFIAISPFLGFHTIMVLIFSWLFSANLAIMLAMSYLINNPFTMIPIAFANYFFGYVLFDLILHLDLGFYEPWWLAKINEVIGMRLPFFEFIVGGTIMALLLSFVSYPIFKIIFDNLSYETNRTE